MALTTTCSFILLSLYLLSTIPKSICLPTYLKNICPNTTFPPNSKYKANLNTLLRSFSSNATANPTGFYITSVGNGTNDAVYGLFLCRGDQDAPGCSDCVTTAANTDLPKTYCPSSKVAIIWYDECLVRYSNESLVGKMDESPKMYSSNTKAINGNHTRFAEVMRKTMSDMVAQTANNRSGMKFSTKMVNFTSSTTLYALEQCTPDLSAGDCNRCLATASGQLGIKQGARLLTPSCNVRYEIYPFYNGAVDFSSPPATNSSAPCKQMTDAGQKNVSVKVFIATVVPIVAISVIIFVIGACFIKKRAKKYTAVVFGSGKKIQQNLRLQS